MRGLELLWVNGILGEKHLDEAAVWGEPWELEQVAVLYSVSG